MNCSYLENLEEVCSAYKINVTARRTPNSQTRLNKTEDTEIAMLKQRLRKSEKEKEDLISRKNEKQERKNTVRYIYSV